MESVPGPGVGGGIFLAGLLAAAAGVTAAGVTAASTAAAGAAGVVGVAVGLISIDGEGGGIGTGSTLFNLKFLQSDL